MTDRVARIEKQLRMLIWIVGATIAVNFVNVVLLVLVDQKQ
jgi:hypothetical protein